MRKAVLSAGLFVAGLIMVVSRPSAHAQEVSMPTTNPSTVVVDVVKGDSLSKIAKKFETTYQRLFDANTEIADPNIIHPGEKIRIPHPDEQIASRALPTQVVAKPKVVKKKSTRKSTSKSVQSSALAVATGSVWDRLAACESGGNWSINTGNGYYGGLQFTAGTWHAVGGQGLPSQNSRDEQIYRAQILQARSGWGQWPACSAKLGLR